MFRGCTSEIESWLFIMIYYRAQHASDMKQVGSLEAARGEGGGEERFEGWGGLMQKQISSLPQTEKYCRWQRRLQTSRLSFIEGHMHYSDQQNLGKCWLFKIDRERERNGVGGGGIQGREDYNQWKKVSLFFKMV